MTETVYLKRRMHVGSDSDQVFHLSTECPHYQKSPFKDRFKEIQRENAPSDSRVCKECSGENNRQNEQNREINQTIRKEGFTFGDLEKTTAGER